MGGAGNLEDQEVARARVRFRYAELNRALKGSEPATNLFDTRFRNIDVRFELAFRLIDGLTLELVIPYLSKLLINPVPPDQALHGDLPQRSESGLGDVELWEHWQALEYLTLSFGLALPTGKTVDNPFEGSPYGNTILQLGSGTVDPLLRFDLEIPWEQVSPVELQVSTSARLAVYENNRRFQAGDSVLAGVGAAHPLLDSKLRPRLAAEVWWRGQDQSLDTVAQDTGGVTFYLSPSVTWKVWEYLELETLVRVPVYHKVNSIQLVESFQLFLGVSGVISDKHL